MIVGAALTGLRYHTRSCICSVAKLILLDKYKALGCLLLPKWKQWGWVSSSDVRVTTGFIERRAPGHNKDAGLYVCFVVVPWSFADAPCGGRISAAKVLSVLLMWGWRDGHFHDGDKVELMQFWRRPSLLRHAFARLWRVSWKERGE